MKISVLPEQEKALSSRERIESACKQPDVLAFDIFHTESLIGFVMVRQYENNEFFLWNYAIDCTRLWVHVFVEPECRNQGIGKALVYEMYRYAKENDIIQLTNFDTTEDNIGFWYEIGFDIFFWGLIPQLENAVQQQ